MKEHVKVFLSAVASGIVISVGGTVYLSVENKILGAFLFTVGLYAIVLNGLHLYTGKIGYFPLEKDKKSYAVMILFTWLGNLAGTTVGALAISNTRIDGVGEAARQICQTKLSDAPLSIFLLAIFCGMLMFIAVEGYKVSENPVILFMGVSVFILCGFEHCIANMFYYSLAGAWSVKAIGYLAIMTVGNAVGGMVIPVLKNA